MAMQTGRFRPHHLGPGGTAARSMPPSTRDDTTLRRPFDRRSVRSPGAATVWLVASLLAICNACSNRSADSARADATPPKPDPRAAFEHIVEEFKEYYRSVDFLMPTRLADSGARQLKVQFMVEQVSHTIDDQPGDEATMTAEMTVRIRTQFALLDAEPDPDSTDEASEGVGGGTPELANGPSKSANAPRRAPLGPPADEFLNSRNREQVHKVAFAYHDGRWKLTPQDDLDPDIKTAVDLALGSQTNL